MQRLRNGGELKRWKKRAGTGRILRALILEEKKLEIGNKSMRRAVIAITTIDVGDSN
jgi:hypothetical protein